VQRADSFIADGKKRHEVCCDHSDSQYCDTQGRCLASSKTGNSCGRFVGRSQVTPAGAPSDVEQSTTLDFFIFLRLYRMEGPPPVCCASAVEQA
jgi:hypothetical protein